MLPFVRIKIIGLTTEISWQKDPPPYRGYSECCLQFKKKTEGSAEKKLATSLLGPPYFIFFQQNLCQVKRPQLSIKNCTHNFMFIRGDPWSKPLTIWRSVTAANLDSSFIFFSKLFYSVYLYFIPHLMNILT